MHAEWQPILAADISEDWKQAARKPVSPEVNRKLGIPVDVPMEGELALELPDYPLAHAWMKWYTSFPSNKDTVAVMVTSQEQWWDRKQELSETLRMLLQEGRPKMTMVIVHHRKDKT